MLSLLLKRISTKSILTTIAWVCACVLVSVLATTSNIYIWLIVLSAFSALILFVKMEYGIFGVLLSIFILDQVAKSYNFLPSVLIWIREIIIFCMLIMIFLRILKNTKVIKTPIDRLIILFVFLGIISLIMNEISLFKALLGFRHYILYVFLFYIIVHIPLKKKTLETIINILFIVALLSGPIAFIERFFLGWAYEDISAGFLSSGSFALFGTAMVCLVSARIIQNGFKFNYLLILISLFATALLAETKAFFFFTPLCLLFQFINLIMKKKGIILYFSILMILIVLSINFAESYHPGTEIRELVLNPAKLWWYLTVDTGAHGVSLNYLTKAGIYENVTLSRISKIIYAHIQAKKNIFSFFLGYGPGSVSSHKMLKLEADKQWEGMGLDQVQISKTIMEFGYLGFFLFLLMIYKIFKMNVIFYKTIQDDYWRSISVGFRGILILFVVGTFYNAVWAINSISFVFWFISASIFIIGRWKLSE